MQTDTGVENNVAPFRDTGMPSPSSPLGFITKGTPTNTAAAARISALLKDLLLTLPIRSFLCESVSMIYFPSEKVEK
ncbi:unnamed protein product [Linum trigynum]|uniref:Uncharacterized protein n=1 Tax=Linum trigynum TaxID=586398 RepID=A0AAV2FBE1_9ROSI